MPTPVLCPAALGQTDPSYGPGLAELCPQTVTASAQGGWHRPRHPRTACRRVLDAGETALSVKSWALEPCSWGRSRQRVAALTLRSEAESRESGQPAGGAAVGQRSYFIQGGREGLADGGEQSARAGGTALHRPGGHRGFGGRQRRKRAASGPRLPQDRWPVGLCLCPGSRARAGPSRGALGPAPC